MTAPQAQLKKHQQCEQLQKNRIKKDKEGSTMTTTVWNN